MQIKHSLQIAQGGLTLHCRVRQPDLIRIRTGAQVGQKQPGVRLVLLDTLKTAGNSRGKLGYSHAG